MVHQGLKSLRSLCTSSLAWDKGAREFQPFSNPMEATFIMYWKSNTTPDPTHSAFGGLGSLQPEARMTLSQHPSEARVREDKRKTGWDWTSEGNK